MQPDVMEILACPDCGLRQRLPPQLPDGWRAQCPRCHRPLARPSERGLALAAVAAALLVWVPACFAPLMRVSTEGVTREGGLIGGVAALWSAGFPSLAVIVATFSIAAPWAYLLLLTTVLTGVHAKGSRAVSRAASPAGMPMLGILFRWALRLRPWTMIEVYLLGACVAYSRIEKVAFVRIGTGGWCLLAAAILVLVADAILDERAVWAAVPIRGPSARDRAAPAA
ncbi:MAG: paraquat-inducible protein A, partial [Steroidobacteraceae bacterium]